MYVTTNIVKTSLAGFNASITAEGMFDLIHNSALLTHYQLFFLVAVKFTAIHIVAIDCLYLQRMLLLINLHFHVYVTIAFLVWLQMRWSLFKL